MKRWLKQLAIYLPALFLILTCFYFLLRNSLANRAIENKVANFNQAHTVDIQYSKVHCKGISSIVFDSLLMKDSAGDTLLLLNSLKVKPSFLQLINGHIRIRKLEADKLYIHIDAGKIKQLFRPSATIKNSSAGVKTGINLSSKAGKLLRRIFTTIPRRLILHKVTTRFTADTTTVLLYNNQLLLHTGKLTADIEFTRDSITQTALLDGKIKFHQRMAELIIRPKNERQLFYSPIASLIGADFLYNQLTLKFGEVSKTDDIIALTGNLSLDRFEICHESLSSNHIPFKGLSMQYNIQVGPATIELDSTSRVVIGKMEMNPYLRLCLGRSDSVVFQLEVPPFSADDFFYSFPAELFPHLNCFQSEGELSYRGKLLVDLDQPDSLVIQSKLNAEGFRITKFDSELFKMRNSFTYTAYEKSVPVRTILVGAENPDFLPLDQIPVLLQQAVLTAEDGSFYGHHGFLISGIQRAVAQNIKEKKLARGGSTISQQLIKNVYLSREKTISRKFEELVLVWLIESNHLVSKSRMLEVYLNIIEWGPDVYGAKEAARFYFNKDVNKLDAAECIFLSSVLPSPKKFYYRFDKQGRLAPFMVNYYIDVAGKLNKKGIIPSSNGDSIASTLTLTGPAKNFLRTDSILADSIQYLEFISEENIE